MQFLRFIPPFRFIPPLRNEIRITGLRDLGIRQCSTSVPTIFWAAKRPKFWGFIMLAGAILLPRELKSKIFARAFGAIGTRVMQENFEDFALKLTWFSLWNSSNRHQIVKNFRPPKSIRSNQWYLTGKQMVYYHDVSKIIPLYDDIVTSLRRRRASFWHFFILRQCPTSVLVQNGE